MSSKLIKNIGQLITNSDENLGIINDAALVIENGKVAWVGENSKAPNSDTAISANNCVVAPGFVDSHTHAVFAGDRHNMHRVELKPRWQQLAPLVKMI
jgi:imidazolonepropionase